MHTTGILLHVYHLGSADWGGLVWGDPARNELGTGAKLFECLLSEPAHSSVHVILYDGPSSKDGMSEGAYTRRFLVNKLDYIDRFPKLRAKYQALTADDQAAFRRRVNDIVLGAPIMNTFEEICLAAQDFRALGVTRVLHIAAASHAPRCIQLQARAREHGLIPSEQLWYTVASDQPFQGATATDTVVVEPPHRADDPLLGFSPTLASLIKQYFALSPAAKKRLIVALKAIVESESSAPARPVRLPRKRAS